MYKEITNMIKDKMNKAIMNLRGELISIRVGRANPSILDRIVVDYYGSMTQINQIANISTPEPRVLVIQPWEKTMLKEIEKVIISSDLGLAPNNDGSCIRLIIPELTEETRKNTVKTVKKIGEDSKVAIRTLRRDGNDKIKKLKKESELTEDDVKKLEEEIQKITDTIIKEIDNIIANKEKEILSI